MNKLYHFLAALTIVAVLYTSCNNQGKGSATGAIQVDSITIYCDDAFKFLMQQEVDIFEQSQPGKHIHIEYYNESGVTRHMLKDSFCFGVIGRKLTEKEKTQLFGISRLQTDEHVFATDAVAVLANPAFKPDTISYTALITMLRDSGYSLKPVFEGNGSGLVRYMFEQAGLGEARHSAFAVSNARDLCDYLQKDKKAVGFIPFARISDEFDTSARSLLKKVKVLTVARTDSSGKIVAATASQSEIADGTYSLVRPINLISHSMNERTGTAFVNFLFREQSGRIILHSGLLPVIMPERVINVHTEPLK